jgi:hypothetical protein
MGYLVTDFIKSMAFAITRFKNQLSNKRDKVWRQTGAIKITV